MSKSKKERQQEKKELRQAQEKAQPKQPQAEKKPEPKPVEAKNAQPETAADVKMNFYSGNVYDHDDYGSCFRSGCDDCSSKRILLYSADSV